ncbi:hypothetical protein TNCV_931781 [Trichonephila clavipes]|uniref:Uncharacterized protein n=1 Tax=Trichonephila clavipes TaxID=2585209 RepID=A0A8X6W2E5_TRICX|nr:hypothetical protein TNCV_931781 [Trichonephila clavipes]
MAQHRQRQTKRVAAPDMMKQADKKKEKWDIKRHISFEASGEDTGFAIRLDWKASEANRANSASSDLSSSSSILRKNG